MSEEEVKVKRILCDLCTYKEEVEVKNSMLSRPKTPETWGYDLQHKDQMCPTCVKKYKEEYKDWYMAFKSSRKNKQGQ